MDVRCGSCNKLFRVADEKIAGKGIKFKCSRCGEVITITKEAFEQDRAARSAAAPQPAPPPVPPQSAMPEPPPQVPAPAPEEQLPPQQTPPPPAALVDFDFSEPHAAQPPDEPFGSTDFSFEAPPMPAHESEPKAEHAPEFPQPPELKPEPKPEPKPVPKAEPKPPVAPKLQPAPAAASEEEIDLGKALAIPPAIEAEEELPKPAPEPVKAVPPVKEKVAAVQKPGRPQQEENVHPLASGNATGIAGGLGCALPVLALMLLGFGMVVKFVPLLSSMPVYLFVAVAGAGLVGLGVLVGLFISVVQAWAGKKLFFLLNILLGALFGAGVGALQSGLVSLARGSGFNLIQLAGSAVGSGITAFFISIAVVIARRIMVSTKEETRSASLSGAQKAGLALSFAVVLFAVYGQWALTAKMETAVRDAAGQLQGTVTAEGLQIRDPYGYIDEATKDLVITGAVENTTGKEKTGWYLVVDVNNDQNAVVARAKMLNGKQLYARRDYDILGKRGFNINEVKARMLFDQGTTVPPGGSVNFELRVMEPPAGIVSFFVTLQPYDPIKVSKGMAEEMQQQ